MLHQHSIKVTILSILLSGTFGCQEIIREIEQEYGNPVEPTTFHVKIENLSEPGTVDTDRADGLVPLSPGVYAVYKGHRGAKAVFTEGKAADEGLELIAEDGMAMVKAEQLAHDDKIEMSGAFPDPAGPILPDGPTMFEIQAMPGYHLQIVTMFVQSNDWFYAFDGKGLPLFDGNEPMHGDVTEYLLLYDAGTEEDTAPGTGPNQVLAQDMGASDVGPDDSVNEIRPAGDRHPGFDIPATASVIKVTIMPQ